MGSLAVLFRTESVAACSLGPKVDLHKYLDDEEEEELVQLILGCAAMGYAKSKQEIIAIVVM